MKALPGSRPAVYLLWLFGAVSLLSLPACATSRLAEEGDASNNQTTEVAYGGTDRERQVGSVAEGDDGQTTRSRTLIEMFSRLPGVTAQERPGGEISLRISGTSSFLAGQNPLIILDGMVMPGGLGTLNPNTIGSITVLKDAAETAIYGSRGANGVILIKTKKG